MTKESNLIYSILKEHFQAFQLVAFDLEGEKVAFSNYETPVQGCALAEAMRSVVNQYTQVPEVWVRNMENEE